MAYTRVEGGVVFGREGISHEIEEGSAPQIHLQGSSTQGGPSRGTSPNIGGDPLDFLRKREKRSDLRFWIAHVPIKVLRSLNLCQRKPRQDASSQKRRRKPRQDASSQKRQRKPRQDASSQKRQRKPRQDASSQKLHKRGEEVPAPSVDDKASEEVSATKRHCETGESSVIKSTPWDSGLTQGGGLVGLHGHKKQLIKLLRENYSVTTDVMVKGGSGVTALVREVCEDVDTKELFGTIAWISVPQMYDSELMHEEIILQLLFKNAPFPGDYADHFTNSSEHNKARCLIVIDNLVDPRTQKALRKVSHLFKTYKVIFMARRDSPINTYGRQCVIYELEELSVEEPWAHFCLKKSPSGDHSSPLKKVCQLVLSKFKNLPGAIVLHLHNRKWAPIIHPSFNFIQRVLEILSRDNHLFCLLYLSIFPEYSEISCKRISRLWVAEGFLPNLEVAETILNDLLDRKCIHPAEKRSDGELSTFRVDNLVREIAASLIHHCNLERITSQDSTDWPESVRYLSVQGTIKGLNDEKTFQLSSTFMLNVSSNEDKTTASEALLLETSKTPPFPSKLKHSKVLDLTDAPFQIIPDGMFELTDLSYWSIRNTSIEVIPGSIERLTRLEFLDAKHSLVTELPPQVARLERLRHILIYHYEKDPLMERYNLIGFRASCRVGELKCLEKLCFVEADDSVLEDLGNLTKLRRLGITKLKKEHGKMLCTSLEELKKLKSLNVHAFDEDETIDLHDLSLPPKYLKHLYLHGRLEKLPDWISSLDCLTKIILRWSQLEVDLLATLGKLPNLVELELCRAYDGEQLDFKEGQFPKLKILLLEELEGLRSMSLEKKTMPCLEDLTISRCHWLEIIPSGIEHIPTIRKLTCSDMSHEFYENVRAVHEKDGYKTFKHIPEVYFTRWRAGHWETDQVESTDEARQVKSTDEAHCSHQVESTDEAPQEMEKSSGFDCEVFLSFRRPDIRANIIDYLYTSMIDAGIRAYTEDEELHVGGEIGSQLLQAIEESKILIPIFSKGYAQSTRCITELVKMVESKNTRRQKIIPIFYDVTPSEVKNQTEHYNNAIDSHAKKKRFGNETINKWRAAVKEVGALPGWDLQCRENRDEGEFVKEVINNVLAELKTTYLEGYDYLVEVDDHVNEIMRMIGAQNDETKIVGIHGIGGIGKTTLAKIVYEKLSHDFDHCCFLSNIRETEITRLQNQLISTILKRQWVGIHDIWTGKMVIEQMLCFKKVLLLLDDVDHASQLNALMQKHESFGEGSKIIITTRDHKILKVPTVVDGTYELTELKNGLDRQLFSKHAFGRDHPIMKYVSHSEKALTVCGGLPLALEALGSFLSGKSVEEWDTILKELNEFPPNDVQRKLIISIEALNEEQQKTISFIQRGSGVKPEKQ